MTNIMSKINVYQQNDAKCILQSTGNKTEISHILKNVGVRYEQWKSIANLPIPVTQEAVLATYKNDIDKFTESEGDQSVDTISLSEDHPNKESLRNKFLAEHTHAEDEVRFFVKGEGLFSLHIEDKVYEVLCTQGDLISVPKNTRHWFDMGSKPNFTAIRLFNNPDGWVAQHTGSDISNQFSRLA